MKQERTECLPSALSDASAPPRGGKRDSMRGHRKHGKKKYRVDEEGRE